MRQGTVIKAYSGFYYVRVDDILYECSLRGRFRKEKQTVITGDRVKINLLNHDKGVIEEILPRDTQLIRPPIANVEQVLIIMAARDPNPDLKLLDRLLILAQAADISPALCFNKAELVEGNQVEETAHVYLSVGYPVIVTSTREGWGLDDLRALLKDKVTVFAGPSGVGKSSLLNAIQPGLALKTGEVSEKIGRGKHTTRHVELLPLEVGGLVADTPGFSTLYLPDITPEELGTFFPEIEEYQGGCRFKGCHHHNEPQCGVKEALEAGEIDGRRYQHYLELLAEVKPKGRKY
ncbi:MAG: ribosome small subunit-dependent GTPase A [Thermincolia bacterium]